MEWFPCICAFIGGVGVSLVDFALMKKAMGVPEKLSGFLLLRTFISAAAVALLYFIGRWTGVQLLPFMIVGALGLTAGLILTTLILMKKQRGGKE